MDIFRTHQRAVPHIPAPAKREEPVTEELIHPGHVDGRAVMIKPPPHYIEPEFSRLYGSQRVENGWQHCIDNYAKGSLTSIAGASANALVTLAEVLPEIRLSRWPGATSFYLTIRSFAIAPILPAPISTTPFKWAVLATAGNVTIYTGAGVLTSVTVAATGTTDLEFQDGDGTVIAEVPATATLDQVFIFNANFNTQLVAVKATTTPVVTVSVLPAAGAVPRVGSLDLYYQDAIGGEVIPLGTGGSTSPLALTGANLFIPTPITDPGVSIVGTLLASLSAGGTPFTYTWQMAFAYAYLLPGEPAEGKSRSVHHYHHAANP